MHWFKILLIAVFIISIISNLVEVSRGEYRKIHKPMEYAIAAIIETVLIFGILYFV